MVLRREAEKYFQHMRNIDLYIKSGSWAHIGSVPIWAYLDHFEVDCLLHIRSARVVRFTVVLATCVHITQASRLHCVQEQYSTVQYCSAFKFSPMNKHVKNRFLNLGIFFIRFLYRLRTLRKKKKTPCSVL